jgi:hypothetical protein
MIAAGSTNFIIHLTTVMVVVSDLQMKERLDPTLLAVCTPLHRQSALRSLDRQGAGLWGERRRPVCAYYWGVKSVNDASRDAVSSETPLDGRQSTTSSPGERVTHFLFLVTVRPDGHEKRHRCR